MDADDDLHAEMRALLRAFLSDALASRCCELLAMKPARWAKIDPWKVWSEIDDRDPRLRDWPRGVAELLADPVVAPHAQRAVVVLRCGHETQASLRRERLADALAGEASVFEGFISIAPGRLGIAVNHDGMFCLMQG